MSDRSAPGAAPSAGKPALPREQLREQMRQQMLTGFGGWTGMAISAAPTVVFIVVNAASTLRAAVIAAVATALVLMAYRLARRQSVQQAASGLFGVVIAAAIAARTGQARGFFAIGIGASFVYGAVFLVSMLVRRPIVGVIWEFLDPTPDLDPEAGGDGEPAAGTADGQPSATAAGHLGKTVSEPDPWFRRPVLMHAYLLATAAATAVFLARGVVQLSLFRHDATGWLAVARIAMGYPLTIAVIGFAWWVVRRARGRLGTVSA